MCLQHGDLLTNMLVASYWIMLTAALAVMAVRLVSGGPHTLAHGSGSRNHNQVNLQSMSNTTENWLYYEIHSTSGNCANSAIAQIRGIREGECYNDDEFFQILLSGRPSILEYGPVIKSYRFVSTTVFDVTDDTIPDPSPGPIPFPEPVPEPFPDGDSGEGNNFYSPLVMRGRQRTRQRRQQTVDASEIAAYNYDAWSTVPNTQSLGYIVLYNNTECSPANQQGAIPLSLYGTWDSKKYLSDDIDSDPDGTYSQVEMNWIVNGCNSEQGIALRYFIPSKRAGVISASGFSSTMVLHQWYEPCYDCYAWY